MSKNKNHYTLKAGSDYKIYIGFNYNGIPMEYIRNLLSRGVIRPIVSDSHIVYESIITPKGSKQILDNFKDVFSNIKKVTIQDLNKYEISAEKYFKIFKDHYITLVYPVARTADAQEKVVEKANKLLETYEKLIDKMFSGITVKDNKSESRDYRHGTSLVPVTKSISNSLHQSLIKKCIDEYRFVYNVILKDNKFFVELPDESKEASALKDFTKLVSSKIGHTVKNTFPKRKNLNDTVVDQIVINLLGYSLSTHKTKEMYNLLDKLIDTKLYSQYLSKNSELSDFKKKIKDKFESDKKSIRNDNLLSDKVKKDKLEEIDNKIKKVMDNESSKLENIKKSRDDLFKKFESYITDIQEKLVSEISKYF